MVDVERKQEEEREEEEFEHAAVEVFVRWVGNTFGIYWSNVSRD